MKVTGVLMELLQILFINPYAKKYFFFFFLRNKSKPQSSLQNKKKSETKSIF